MERDTATRLRISALIYTMTNAVLFGAGAITVLSVPELSENAAYLIPAVVVASLILAAPVAWFVAPRLRIRSWRRQRLEEREQAIPVESAPRRA